MRFLDTSAVRIRLDERVRAADGTELSVDLYLPAETGRYPVLLTRTPLDNNRPGRPGLAPPAERWKTLAAQGFIVAAGDVRGRGDSEGSFRPFVHEGADGAATLAWLREFDEFGGRIGVFGSGYGAFCAWAAAVADRGVDAVASISPFGAVGEGLPHRGGVVRLDWLFWMHLVGGRNVQPPGIPPWQSIFGHFPIREMDEALGRNDIWWREWLESRDGSSWSAFDLLDDIKRLRIPGLHITGWWDGASAASHRYYTAAAEGMPQDLIVGPWDSATVRRPAGRTGGFDLGPRATLDLDETLAAFFKTKFGAGPAARAAAPRFERDRGGAQVFITGLNEWTSLESWPASDSEAVRLWLASGGGANTRRGDGRLDSEPSGDALDSVTHNPAVPVRFQPEAFSFAQSASGASLTLDQAHITSRDEALVYTTAPLSAPLTIVGQAKVALTVQVDTADADIFVLLSDVFPAGARELNLAHGACRLATLRGFTPNELCRVEIELDACGHVFLPGHAVRLTVTPSLFPLYARNPQGADYLGETKTAVATLRLHHGNTVMSVLELPVLHHPALDATDE